jgi:hypothetical protein
MRMVVWNCWGGLTGDRAECLLALRPDVVLRVADTTPPLLGSITTYR